MTTTIKFFTFTHLKDEKMREISELCSILAHKMEDMLPENAEKSAGMRKLLEAKDCFVRTIIE